MNQTQLKYARVRAEAILYAKEKAITLKHTTDAKTLTNEQKIDALFAGTFKLNSSTGPWNTRIDFGETFKTVDTEKCNLELKIIREKFTRIMDELVLGDNNEALLMLKEFEAYV